MTLNDASTAKTHIIMAAQKMTKKGVDISAELMACLAVIFLSCIPKMPAEAAFLSVAPQP